MTKRQKKVSRRGLLIGIGATAAAYALGVATPGMIKRLRADPVRDALNAVVPSQGHRTAIAFGDSIVRLVRAGVIDPEKFTALYAARGGLPDWARQLLEVPSTESILISSATAPYLLNLLWPVGLATRAGFNAESPLNSKYLSVFASTAGWRLGRAATGTAYFNQVEIMTFSEEQEARVVKVAKNAFRPCCDNSAYFQDCNHGSAMLGLLELGAAQGLSEGELFRVAKVINGYWYPTQYIEIALLFDAVKGVSWEDVDPATVVSASFSSVSGWRENVHAPLSQAGFLFQRRREQQAGCAA